MSDEKGKEKVEIVEGINHFYHHHPLTLRVRYRRSGMCYGCRRYIHPEEMAYACREGCGYPILHEECAEMPREIRLWMHPHHTLLQKETKRFPICAVCEKGIYQIGYYCSSLDGCEFQVHVGCAQNMGVIPSYIDHPSHPHQRLTLLWRPGRSCLSRCDACGTIEEGNSYMCMGCQYWIHESCASLPATADYHRHHHHPLSLVYYLPLEYIRFDFTCNICLKDLLPKYWAYHCATCRYVVHIKCAISTTTMNTDANAADAIVFPTNNTEEVIKSFVTQVGGAILPNPNEMDVNGKYRFHCHDHDLHLISPSLNDQEEEEEEEDSYDDGLKHGELVCDGCTMPIFPNKHKSDYMSCGECKYFLHWACFHLPPELSSHPLHPHHNLALQTCPKLESVDCYVCGFHTNGLFYRCKKCSFRADIKCISLPDTIKHAAHPRHLLKLLDRVATQYEMYLYRVCGACSNRTSGDVCYICDICEIMFHASCVVLPAVVSNREWDKHPLPLTFDACIDHPSGFYCDICEQQMNPKLWMYHCRTCDFSLHPRCYPPASGEYRNIKFGQRYDVASEHHHPLTYQRATKNLKCDVCGRRKVYGSRGFLCTSHNCDFFMCFLPCVKDRKPLMQAVALISLLYFLRNYRFKVQKIWFNCLSIQD